MNTNELRTLLTAHCINVAAFGQGAAKTLEHLSAEIAAGETRLGVTHGRLTRLVKVLGVNVFVDQGGERLRLVEDRQVFADGRVRRRMLPTSISEKLHPDENIFVAIDRALKEELGIEEYTLLTEDPQHFVELEESPSYPGLLTEYVKYKVDVSIAPSQYWRARCYEVQSDKTTYFVWTTSK